MAHAKLKREFFKKPTLFVAKSLLGQVLVRRIGRKEIRGIICETEAYVGEKDKACHARHGRTSRSEVLYRPAGYSYVYLIYGMYHCFNAVTEKKNFPSAVLIRGVIPEGGIEKISGPGRVCKFFQINKKFNDLDLIGNDLIWFERGSEISAEKIKRFPRIGVEYAGSWAKKPWRFVLDLENNTDI